MASYQKKEQDYRAYLEAGMGPSLIAQMTGDAVPGLAAYLRKLPDWGVIQQPGVMRCREMRRQGYELKHIAKYTGWSAKSVHKFCLGIPAPENPIRIVKPRAKVQIIPAQPELTQINKLLMSPWGTKQWM